MKKLHPSSQARGFILDKSNQLADINEQHLQRFRRRTGRQRGVVNRGTKNTLKWLLPFVIFVSGAAQAEADQERLCPAGSYHAKIPIGSNEAELTATVVLPTTGYQVKFVQRPERILPPMFNIVCKSPSGNVPQVFTPYTTKISVPQATGGDLITIFDASGNRTAYVSKECGGIVGAACSLGNEFCHFEDGICSSHADAVGLCLPKPSYCTGQYAPVAGCDGETYTNSCFARAAGTSVAKKLLEAVDGLGGVPWPWNTSIITNEKLEPGG